MSMAYDASSPGIVKQRCPTPKYVGNEGGIGLKYTKPEASLYNIHVIVGSLIL